MNEMVNVLMIEADKSLLQDVVKYLSDNVQCQVTKLSVPGEQRNILTFPNLEIRINEQIVYHNGIPVPLTHHEFFTLFYLVQHPSWVLSKEQKSRSTKRSGKRTRSIAGRQWRMWCIPLDGRSEMGT